MSVRRRLWITTGLVAVVAAAATAWALERFQEASLRVGALRLAEVVAAQVSADRAEYATNVVDKLVQDGTGASRESETARGFIQLPAQFVHNVSRRVRDQAGDLYTYSLISRWNLNPTKGLDESFDRWAWQRLAAQNEQFLAGPPAGPSGYPWRPVYRVESVFGEPVLRYMRADPAAAQSCIDCHQRYEQTKPVQESRELEGVPVGKTWKRHELMGGLRVDVPLREVAALSDQERTRSLGLIALILAAGLVVVLGLIDRTLISPIERLEAPDAELAGRLRQILTGDSSAQSSRSNSK